MEAQVVYEREVGGDLQHGPCEFVRVGVRINDRVFWIECAHFPGSNGVELQRGEALAKEIAEACIGQRDSGMRRALERIAELSVPDQPAACGDDDDVWIMRHVSRLRKIASDALLESGS